MRLTILVSSLACLNAVVASKQGLRHQKQEQNQVDSCVGLFNELDVNKDGSLTRSDLATLLSGQGLKKTEIKAQLSGVDKHTKIDMAEFCNDKEKKKVTRKKKALNIDNNKKGVRGRNHDLKTQTILQGLTPKDLRISRNSCQEAFNRLNPVNGETPISGIADVLESYYDDFASSDLTDLIDRYGTDALTDYPNFEYYVCSNQNSESSSDSGSYRNGNDDDDSDGNDDSAGDDGKFDVGFVDNVRGKNHDLKTQTILQGLTPKDLRISRNSCQEAFNRLNPVNGETPISGIADILESYYDDFASSDLNDLIDRYGTDAVTDYPNFEYYVCSNQNSESSSSSSSDNDDDSSSSGSNSRSYRNDNDDDDDDDDSAGDDGKYAVGYGDDYY